MAIIQTNNEIGGRPPPDKSGNSPPRQTLSQQKKIRKITERIGGMDKLVY